MSTITSISSGDSTRVLVGAAQDGDRRAVDLLIDRYASVVWATARSFRLGEADVHDAVQNTWLRMIEHLGDLRDADRLPGWLATTARRECLSIVRQGRREVVGLDPAVVESVEAGTPDPERAVIERSMGALLWARVAELPPTGRVMVTTLTGADAPSYQEFARVSGMPIGSIGPRRMRYLRRLRGVLERCDLGPRAWVS